MTVQRLLLSLLIVLWYTMPSAGRGIEDINPDDSTFSRPDSSHFFDFKKEPEDTVVYYEFFDSLKSTFFQPSMELSTRLERTPDQDPSALLKFNPSNFIVDYQILPMRRTLHPAGLPGNRSNVILDIRPLNPLEHIVVPDGKTDLEDYPLAQVDKAWNIEGPLGMAFDGGDAVSTLFMIPYKDLSGPAKSGMKVSDGDYSFNDTRGYFASTSQEGRVLKAAAQYRNVDGAVFNFDDDAYHQWAEVFWPINERNQIGFTGRLYKRDGNFPFVPFYAGASLRQFRRDRDLSVNFVRDHKSGGRSTVEYRHQRSESLLENIGGSVLYYRNLDYIDNGLHLRHERRLGQFDAAAGMYINLYEYHDSERETERKRAKAYLNLLKGDSLSAWTGYLSLEKLGGYNPAPSVMLAYTKKKPGLFWQASAAYNTKLPRMYELDMIPEFAGLYTGSGDNYFERGAGYLEPEKQMIASFSAGYGEEGNDWQLYLTGGKIIDGIDWSRRMLDTLGATVEAWKPVNHDIEFANATLIKRISLWDQVWLYGGGTIRHSVIGGDDSPPFSPDYQGFAAIELYQYLDFIGTHLYGYLEGNFIGEYTTEPSYDIPARTLGNFAVINLKLSFRIKKFRFHFVSQNLLSEYYLMRGGYDIAQRISYYGITWHFLN